MNRTDELTDRLIESSLSDAEASELAAITSTDLIEFKRHLALLNLEASLRGLRTDINLGAEVVRAIEATRAGRVAASVLAEIADRASPVWVQRRPPCRRKKAWLAAVGLTLAVTLFLGIWLASSPSGERPHLTPPESAHLRVIAGFVEVSGQAGTEPIATGQLVSPGQTVRTVGDDSAVVIEFPDHTTLELNADTEVRFASVGDPSTPRVLHLVQGQVSVVVTGRQTLLSNGTAEISTRNGSYSAWASGLDSLRVESKEGDIQVVRVLPANSVAISPGRAAFVRDGITPTHLEPRFEVITAPRATLDFPGALDVAFTDNGNAVWATSAKQRVRWRPFEGTTERIAFDPPVKNDGPVAVLSRDGASLVACRVDEKVDRIAVRDIVTGAICHTIPQRVSEPRFLCTSSDATWLATFDHKPDRRLRLWDTATERVRFAHDLSENTHCLAATPDGRHLAVDITNLRRTTDNRVDFFDAESGEVAFSLPTARRAVTAMAFTPNGKFLAAGFNGSVQIWDIEHKRLMQTIEGFERVVSCIAFSPDGRSVAAGTQDGQVWLWSTETGQRIQVLGTGTRGVRALAFNPDGKSLVTATNRAPVALWDIAETPRNDAVDAP